MSPAFFAIYIEGIINALRLSKLGSRIGVCFLGCVLYADDTLLLSHSVSVMQQMLDVCTTVIKELDLRFNAKKSAVTCVGTRFKEHCEMLTLDGSAIVFATEITYLGVCIVAGKTFVCSFNACKLKFHKSFNALWLTAKSANSEMLLVHLLKT